MRLLHLLAASLLPLTGCHSAFIDATVSNRTADIIPLIEVDYPAASFGTENLAPGADFHYRFKVLGTGPLKVVYTDSSRREKTIIGPALSEGDEGALTLTFTPAGPQWQVPPSKRQSSAEPVALPTEAPRLDASARRSTVCCFRPSDL